MGGNLPVRGMADRTGSAFASWGQVSRAVERGVGLRFSVSAANSRATLPFATRPIGWQGKRGPCLREIANAPSRSTSCASRRVGYQLHSSATLGRYERQWRGGAVSRHPQTAVEPPGPNRSGHGAVIEGAAGFPVSAEYANRADLSLAHA